MFDVVTKRGRLEFAVMEVGSDGQYAYFRVLFAIFLLHPAQGCRDSPVGIADSSIIPDDRFTASSYYAGNAADTRYKPKNARLNGAIDRGWGPSAKNDPNDYLQIDFGQVFVICAVATQGCTNCAERTTQYKISTSVDNSTWTTYKTGSTDKLFTGNTKRDTVVKNVLDYPVLVRYIKFTPTDYSGWKVLRVEAYGLRRGVSCSSLPVGIGSGKIPNSDVTSSSVYNSTTSPSKARLNYTAGSSWCAATSDSSPYLQINLGSPYIICGIATQGDHMTDQWVQAYNMLTSNNGSTFTKYMENSQVKSLTGNFDPNTAVKNLLYDGTVGQYIRVAPTSHYGSTNCMRTELYGIKQDGGCTAMFVGLSYSNIIPDHRFTASSHYVDYLPNLARLLTSSKAWTPTTQAGGDWLQIDLGSVVFLCAVATQGSGPDLSDEYARSYKIQVSLDNVKWNYYQENNNPKIFPGNSDRNSVKTNSLAHPLKAKFIRFYPVDYKTKYWPSMRAEVYGMSSACSSPVGLEAPGVIQNIQMTSLSDFDNNHSASHGRLYGRSAWCSSTQSNTEYIQINLGQVMTVTGIATQGDHINDKWVTNYTISYNMDGNNMWNTYKAGSNSDKIFKGNSDKDSVRVQWLSHPVTARHVRVTPQTWNTGICMRIELYGCDYATRPVISGLNNQNLTAAAHSYVDLMCIVHEPLIQYIKWYTGNTDITSQSTGLVRGANGVKQSTLRINYTTADDVVNTYDCKKSVCFKAFICKAMYETTNTNADGIKSAGVTVKLDYPTALAAPTVNDIKSTSVTVEWIQPALNASQASVTSYVLHYQDSTDTQKIDVPALATSRVITGLAVYTSYSVKIKVISRVGPGQWSANRNFRTDSAVPVGFPTSVTAVAQSSQSIRVTWQKPGSGINGALLGYKVFYGSGSNDFVNVTGAGKTSCDINNLQIWTFYRITVKCYNIKGDGPPSAETVVRTEEDAPGQPERFAVTVLNSTSVRLSWALPTTKNGIIRKFKLRYDKTGGPSSNEEIRGNTTLSYVLTGLDKCTLYSFRILARTIIDGPYTSEIHGTTDVDAPSAPTNFKGNIVKPNGPSVPQVTLTWEKPVVCGDNVLQYKVLYSLGGDLTFKVETVDKSKLTVTIPVWGGVTYGFRVRGVTIEEGPDTPTKTFVVPVYSPSVSPSNLTFGDVNKTTFNFSWSQIPRSKSNGPVLVYEVNQTLVRRGRARRSIDAVGQVKMMNSSCCSHYLHDLLVCAEYHISIKGYTSAGAGPSVFEPLKTSAPGSPEELTVQTTKKREASLTWQKPKSVTEKIETYTIMYEGKKDYNTSFVHSGSLEVSSITEKEVPDLYPGTHYTFRVSATTACGKGDNSSTSSSTTKVDAPPAPFVELVGNITAEVNNVTVWQSSNINGQIMTYQIIVLKVDETSSFDKTKLKSYEEAEKEKLHYYIAAEIKADGDKKFPRVFILGDEKEHNGYKNVKLMSGAKYQVSQRAMTQDDKTPLPGDSVVIAKGQVPANKGVKKPKSSTGGGTVPAIVGVAVVLVLGILVAAIFLWKRRNRERESPDDLDNALDLNNIQNEPSSPNSRTNLVAEGSRGATGGSTNGALNDEDADLYGNADALRHQPIPINKFPSYVTEKKSGDSSFKEEFKTLSNGQQHPWDNARTPRNKPKNRYANIIAYDHARVILHESVDDSDYINASYIHGFDETPRTYIASQGPIPTSAADFWLMVWQEKVKTVVMLTNLIEGGRVKCHQYWPDNKETYGPMTITLHRSDVLADYVVRVFIVSKSGEEGKIQVNHFQYTAWPDKGVPQHATSVLGFRRKVRANYASVGAEGPLLVHCSAGVGRTGAFIAVDAMLERTRKDKTIDIFNFVQLMRNNRITMVQTEEQYAFVHYAVLEALTCGNTEVPVMNLNIVMGKLSKPRPKDQMIGYEVEFKRLNHISPALLTQESSDIGQMEENMSRNRYPDVIPLDCARVFLSNEKQNYINASFANAYRERNAFIMTQAPLEHTIYDFWHMVHQYKIGSIVMLNLLQEGEETFPPYVPSEGTQSYNGIKVEVTAVETKGPLIIKKCKLVHPMEPQIPHEFIHVQHTKWLNQSIPESRQSVLDLVTTVQRSQQQCGNTPIAVQCSDGVGRSGTFAAVYSLLERVKAEQVLDVFQAIKVLRLGRPNAVKTLEQYKFCYIMVQTYLDSFNDYANFSEV